MASSGKKGKKSKGITLPLNDFLQETCGLPTIPVKKYDWSDEVEDAFESGGYESRAKTSMVVLPTAPRAARGPDISDDRIPTQPPFMAYISNLPYDVDEQDIAGFFANMTITNMRLPRDDRGGEGGKLKGFGYVEFEDRASLIDAISIVDTNLKGRRIKIDVATSSDGGERRRGGRMDMGRDRQERPEVAMGDWRSGPRTEPTSDNRTRDRDDSNRSGAWRDSADRPSYRDSDRSYSDRGRFGDSDRRSGFDSDRRSGFDSDRRSGYDNDRRSGFDSERRSGFDNDRRSGFSGRRYGDRERDGDSEFRRSTAPSRDEEQSRSRPKLKLAPRTIPLAEQNEADEKMRAATPASTAPTMSTSTTITTAPAASIFGAAKPVDTSVRERQIEERLAKEKEVQSLPVADAPKDDKLEDDEEARQQKKEGRGRKYRDDDYSENTRRESPERRPSSRGQRYDEKKPGLGARDKGAPRKDEKPAPRKDDRLPRDNNDKEMPKLKEPEPPNFAASNIYATLEAEGDLSE